MPVDIAMRDEKHFNLLGIQTTHERGSSKTPLCESALLVDEKNKKQSTKRRQRRTVSFSPLQDEVHHVLHVNEMREEEICDTWYRNHDYECFRAGMAVTIAKMNDGQDQEDDEETSRGLEHRTKSGAQRGRLSRFRALQAVMNEQEDQIIRMQQQQQQQNDDDDDDDDNDNDETMIQLDDEAIRRALAKETRRSAQEALAYGLMDEAEARNIRQADKKSKKRKKEKKKQHGDYENGSCCTEQQSPSKTEELILYDIY